MNNSTEYTKHNDPFYVSPNVPPFIYTASCVLMFFTTIFGIPANTSIFVLFFNTPLVSTYYITITITSFRKKSFRSTKCSRKVICKVHSIIFWYFKHFLIFQIRTPFNYVLMNMVFAEFIIAAFGLPVDFMASFYHGWKMGQTLCHVTGFILTTTGMYKPF